MINNKPDISGYIHPVNRIQRNVEQRVLFVGQKTASGIAKPRVITSIGVNDFDRLFGANSMLAYMCREFRKLNTYNQLDAIALEDSTTSDQITKDKATKNTTPDIPTASTPASGTLTFGGTCTYSGALILYIGSRTNYKYEVSVQKGVEGKTISDLLKGLIDKDTTIPVTTTSANGILTITAINTGLEGNKIGLQIINRIEGVTCTISPMNGGLGNPEIKGLFDIVGNTRYQTIVIPSTYDINELAKFLSNRWNIANIILNGIGITSITDTKENLISLATPFNNQSIVIFGNKPVSTDTYKGSSIFELDYVIASQFSAIRSLRYTDGVDISQFNTVTDQMLDNYGGIAINTLPYANTKMINLPITDISLGFGDSKQDIDDLDKAGISVMLNNDSKSYTVLNKVVTTYKKNQELDIIDISYHPLNYVDTITAFREFVCINLRLRFAMSRLSLDGNPVAGRNIATKIMIEQYIDRLYAMAGDSDHMLVQYSDTNMAYFKRNRSVTVVTESGAVQIVMKVPIITQLDSIRIDMYLDFGVTA